VRIGGRAASDVPAPRLLGTKMGRSNHVRHQICAFRPPRLIVPPTSTVSARSPPTLQGGGGGQAPKARPGTGLLSKGINPHKGWLR
jgi:hypothetical protein